MSKELINNMVSRFLGWKLPKDFSPDAGISFKREANAESPAEFRYNHEPIGTNLFHAGQAEAMLTHVAKPLLDRAAGLDAENNHLRAVANAAISFLKDGEVKILDRITELEARPEATRWQPIETAPKDGTEVLLKTSKTGRIANGLWSATNSKYGFWVWAYIQAEPAYWMPLPTEVKA